MSDNVIPFGRPAPERPTGRTCICGAKWKPGFSSDPAWLLTADPRWKMFFGVLYCHCCGRDKLEVIREQAEQERASRPPAIVVQREERPPATVTELHPTSD